MADLLQRLANVCGCSPADVLTLSDSLRLRAQQALEPKLTLQEEVTLERHLRDHKAQEQTPGQQLAKTFEETVAAADGSRRAKYRLPGGTPFASELERAALPN